MVTYLINRFLSFIIHLHCNLVYILLLSVGFHPSGQGFFLGFLFKGFKVFILSNKVGSNMSCIVYLLGIFAGPIFDNKS